MPGITAGAASSSGWAGAGRDHSSAMASPIPDAAPVTMKFCREFMFSLVVSRVTRQTMVEQLDADHVSAARSFGLAERKIVTRHVLRNSWGPIITMVALVVASLLAGTVVIESVFGISGVGALLVDAINAHDFTVVQAVLLYMVIGYMIVTTLVDFLLPLLDPRINSKVSSS